jgi:acyl-homoserine-lactone acylase
MRPAALAALIGAAACTGDAGPLDPYDVEIGPYDATIRRTAHGIPHVSADDVPSVYFGTGYAFAQDHVCTLADQILKVRSERSRFFGPGEGDANLESDVAWKVLRVFADAEARWFALPEDIRAAIVAYAAGYNAFLNEVGPEGLPAPCRGAAWVRPITHIDLLAHYLHLGQMASGFPLLDYIATAAPPVDAGARTAPPPLHELGARLHPRDGSNGVALGAQRTATGRGMLFSNSHYEAEGERRWWEFQQTVPGELDVYGVALPGVPLVNMGFNAHVAWTHTVSTTPRFLIYALELQPGNPTRYRYDGGWRDMTTETITVDVLGSDGQIAPVSRTMYRSHHGPMLNAPLIGWTGLLAFTYRDVNASNLGMIPAWWNMNRARSVGELADAQLGQGIPWVHTIAADADGETYYGDTAAAPNLSPAAESAFDAYLASNFIARQFRDQGAWVVDGADPVFEWVDEGTPIPGAVPVERSPRRFSRDVVANSNENHWLSTPEAPLEGFAKVYGAERAARQGRTKITARVGLGRTDIDHDGADDRYDLDELQAAVLSYPSHYADVLRPQLAARCAGAPPIEVTRDGVRTTVDLTEACDVLAAWDGTYRADARGAHLFREWIGSGAFALGRLGPFVRFDDLSEQGKIFADPFDPAAPLDTPSVLVDPPADGPDPILVALAQAVLTLRAVDLPLDARLGDVQYRLKAGVRTPCPGGKELEGSMMIADWRTNNSTLLPREHDPRGAWVNEATELTADGYPVSGGDSWVATIGFTDDGPRADAVLIYSQSSDPDSPFFNDQAALHGAGRLRPIRFSQADIDADPALSTTRVSLP